MEYAVENRLVRCIPKDVQYLFPQGCIVHCRYILFNRICFNFFLESLKNHHVHRRAGLPAKFWVTIAFLIVGFHLYLAKLIYSECFKEKDIVRSKIYMS